MKALKYMTPLILAGVLLVSCSLIGQGETRETLGLAGAAQSGPQPRQLQILTTVKLLADMVDDLSDGQHTVHFMARSSGDLASAPPDPASLEAAEYDSLFFVGAGYEPFIREFTEQLDKNKINVVNVSRGVEILRYKVNKLDAENPYYLMNSTNYKIALNSIKNSLQEMDPARKVLYDERFVAISREIDGFQSEVSDFISAQDRVIYLVDSDLPAYLVQEYQQNYQPIAQFIERKVNETASTQAVGSVSTAPSGAEYRIFLYTEDVSLQKYADDIVKYSLIPVRIHLYDDAGTLRESFRHHFELIRDALAPTGP